MAPQLPTHRKLFWAIWRLDMIACSASTASGFVWVFGFTAVFTVLAFDPNMSNELIKDRAVALAPFYLAGLFGGGLFLMFMSSRIVYHRFGLICPSCESRLDSARKNRQCRSNGCCPACGKPMDVTSHNPSLNRSGRSGENPLEG